MQLQHFLAPAWAEQVAAAVAGADAEAKLGRGQVPGYEAGVAGGWQAVGPCHKQRYLCYAPGSSGGGDEDGGGAAATAAVGALLAQIREELFSTAAFARLLTKVRTGGRTAARRCKRLPQCCAGRVRHRLPQPKPAPPRPPLLRPRS